MKQVKFLLLMITGTLLFLYACKDEDKMNRELLSGYWVHTYSETSGCRDADSDSVSCEDQKCLTYYFRSGGSLVRGFNSISDTGTYSLNEDMLTLCLPLFNTDTTQCIDYRFTVSSAVLRLILDDEEDPDCEYHTVFSKRVLGTL